MGAPASSGKIQNMQNLENKSKPQPRGTFRGHRYYGKERLAAEWWKGLLRAADLPEWTPPEAIGPRTLKELEPLRESNPAVYDGLKAAYEYHRPQA
jgi:hypothetical protein